MARPRTPSNVLELKGAFKKHPERRRDSVVGSGPFDPHPPAHLPQECARAWHHIVSQIPAGVLTASDQTSIEIMARLQAGVWMSGDRNDIKELFRWLGQYGMTAAAREKIAAKKPEGSGNPFADL